MDSINPLQMGPNNSYVSTQSSQTSYFHLTNPFAFANVVSRGWFMGIKVLAQTEATFESFVPDIFVEARQ